MKLYHWTKRVNVSSILQKGLVPKHKNWCVYLTPKPERYLGFPKDDDVCLEVETGDLELTAFDDCKDWEVLCWGIIPPENIIVLNHQTNKR